METADALEKQIAGGESQEVNMDMFLSVVRCYAVMEKPTTAIVHKLINRIIAHETEQARWDRRQKVELFTIILALSTALYPKD